MPKKPPEKDVFLTAEEADLWQQVAETVTPMRKKAAKPVKKAAKTPPARTKTPEPPPAPLFFEEPQQVTKLPAEESATGMVAGVDKRTLQRLKAGKMPIEARLDLHGHTQEEAHQRLRYFLAMAYDLGKRCVLVITGKGGRREGDGVLRAQFPRWLREEALSDKVLLHTEARPEHGGQGAFYVLLRRQK